MSKPSSGFKCSLWPPPEPPVITTHERRPLCPVLERQSSGFSKDIQANPTCEDGDTVEAAVQLAQKDRKEAVGGQTIHIPGALVIDHHILVLFCLHLWRKPPQQTITACRGGQLSSLTWDHSAGSCATHSSYPASPGIPHSLLERIPQPEE